MLPRTVIPAYWLARLLLLPARVGPTSRRALPSRVAIESGRIGWTHVFYEELSASAEEYLDGVPPERLVIDRDQPYRPQFRVFARTTDCTHIVLDLRTGPQTWRAAMQASMEVAWTLIRKGITPIVVLTDASLRRHRLQAAILTAFSGVVVTFMSADLVRPMFPHGRIIGPLPMPVSVHRLERLEQQRDDGQAGAPRAAFIGSVYPPRAQFLEALSAALRARGVELQVNADKYGTSNDDYWAVLSSSDVIVTTTLQGMPRPGMDWIWIQQLVFRFSEALCAGAVLVAPEVPGGDRWFSPDEDFVPFTSVDEACERICSLISDSHQRASVREHGHRTAAALSRDHAFWRAIDECLAQRALRP